MRRLSTNWGRWPVLMIAGLWLLMPLRAEETTTTDGADSLMRLLPLLTGNLQGVVTPIEGRPLTWSLALPQAGGGGVRKGEAKITGQDMSLKIAVEFDPEARRLRWRVTEGRVGMAGWLAVLATRPELAEALAGATATGTLEIAGEGVVDGKGPTGTLTLDWREGTARNDDQGWSVEGINLRIGGDVAKLAAGTVPVRLSVKTLSTSTFGARNLTLGAGLRDFERVEVTGMKIEIAGGFVSAAPFSFSMAAPVLSVDFDMRGVGLQDLVVFVPATLTEAKGRISGKLKLDWNPTDGVQVGAGELVLDKSEPTTLRLAANPGFLTEEVPMRFVLAPWLGPLKGLFSPVNPSYKTMQEIELGKLGLLVEALDVRLTPEGDPLGRSASIFVRARPEKAGSVIDVVTFQINVSGPLSQVLRLGMEQNFSIQLK